MMYNRGQLVLGIILLGLGVLFLIGTLFQINVWALCWPIGLILVGVWMVARPNLSGGGRSDVVLLGDVRRRGVWDAASEDIWLGIGSVDLDLTQAVIPAGETLLNIYGFIGDVDILVPRSVGVAVRVNGFVVDSELLGQDYDSFLAPVEIASPNYSSAEQRLRIEMTAFVADIKVRHV